ncbi:hypothetical protein PtA15_4A159 [Puccinia triticina]|uniref:Uncharacterized protein n=2 Tax=Puccinia triticina TaxID=208348 RepID=A0ABY7CHV0_9BASI|nr:uncharacterized protein PtA15_4A159 [Puccinia triticina]WAQ83711.1 hypothetical protein PtA15_4A159 [Puccinia triticina]
MVFTNENTSFKTRAVQVLLLYCILLNPVDAMSMALKSATGGDGLGTVVGGLKRVDNLNLVAGAGKGLGSTAQDSTKLGDTGTTTLDLAAMREGSAAKSLAQTAEPAKVTDGASKVAHLNDGRMVPFDEPRVQSTQQKIAELDEKLKTLKQENDESGAIDMYEGILHQLQNARLAKEQKASKVAQAPEVTQAPEVAKAAKVTKPRKWAPALKDINEEETLPDVEAAPLANVKGSDRVRLPVPRKNQLAFAQPERYTFKGLSHLFPKMASTSKKSRIPAEITTINRFVTPKELSLVNRFSRSNRVARLERAQADKLNQAPAKRLDRLVCL